MGSGVTWVDGQGLVEASQRRVMASERSKRDTPIAMGRTRPWIHTQGIVEQPHGFRRLALLQLEDSKHMQGIEIPGLRLQHVAIDPLGIA